MSYIFGMTVTPVVVLAGAFYLVALVCWRGGYRRGTEFRVSDEEAYKMGYKNGFDRARRLGKQGKIQ